jgi:uncharacterized alpha-E superfamily protein
MISRVAEQCFWMARYLERVENTARILEVNRTLLLDFQVPLEQQWKPLLTISGIHDFEGEPTAEGVQAYMTWERDNPFSIVSSLYWARENARIVREVISGEMWERLNFYHLWMQGPAGRDAYDGNRYEFYAQVRRINQLIHGIADTTMGHGAAWEFFKLGTHLERASQTARVMDVKYHTLLPSVEDVGTPVDNAQWFAILMSCSGYEPFHQKVGSIPIDPATAVAEFLIYDAQFPRSIRRCLWECEGAAAAAAGNPVGRAVTPAERAIAELIGWLEAQTIHTIVQNGLHESLTHVVNSAHAIGDAVNASFFAAEVNPQRPASQSQNGRSQTQTLGGMSQTQS